MKQMTFDDHVIPPEPLSLDLPTITSQFSTETDYRILKENHQYLNLVCTRCGDETKTVMLGCGDRTCPVCNSRRRKIIMEKYSPVVKAMKNPMFFTLTLKRGKLSRGRVKYLQHCFGKLRRSRVWKGTGYIAQIEVKNIDPNGDCHLHLHVIVDGEYMPQRDLSAKWMAITKDSYIVDIRACKGSRLALRYMTKHMGKMIKDSRNRDLINGVFRGCRMIQAGGNIVNSQLIKNDCTCEHCGAVNCFISEYNPEYLNTIWAYENQDTGLLEDN